MSQNGACVVLLATSMWVTSHSNATVNGTDLGRPVPTPQQAHLHDFAIPQRGMFVIGRAYFSPVT